MLIAWGNSNSFYDILKAIVKKYVGDFLKLPLYVYLLSSKAKAGKSREHNLRKILAFPGIFCLYFYGGRIMWPKLLWMWSSHWKVCEPFRQEVIFKLEFKPC